MKHDKSLVGSLIYAVDALISAQGQSDLIYEFLVVDVTDDYVWLSRVWNSQSSTSHTSPPVEYCLKKGLTRKEVEQMYGKTGGLKFFESQEELETHLDERTVRVEVLDQIRSLGHEELSLSQLLKIKAIIEGKAA